MLKIQDWTFFRRLIWLLMDLGSCLLVSGGTNVGRFSFRAAGWEGWSELEGSPGRCSFGSWSFFYQKQCQTLQRAIERKGHGQRRNCFRESRLEHVLCWGKGICKQGEMNSEIEQRGIWWCSNLKAWEAVINALFSQLEP